MKRNIIMIRLCKSSVTALALILWRRRGTLGCPGAVDL